MRALVFDRKPLRFVAANVAGSFLPGRGAKVGPLELDDVDPPDLPAQGWVRLAPRLAGICGSDLATVDGASSRYFEHIVSFPFVPGHEVVADVLDGDLEGQRVVLEPVLGCVTRGIDPPCPACARGDLGGCERVAFGAIEPGLQTGFCCDTGGGWSQELVAHPSQLHAVPESFSDEAAVMVEPTACGIHAALAAGVREGDRVAVLGAGTIGLTVIAALARWTKPETVIVAARYGHQKRWARELGATQVVEPGQWKRAIRLATGSLAWGEGEPAHLTGGADVVIDCVGSSDSIAEALAVVKPKGRVVVAGMPSDVSLDLTGLWHREVNLVGAYAYGTERLPGTDEERRTFDLAFELVEAADLGRLVSATYPLASYTEALAHAAEAGSRDAVKVAFDLHAKQRSIR
jgi:threonine dehydrogenase-like Zn-dependent dehydrogenase